MRLAGALAWSVGRPDEIPFEKHTLDLGSNETCAVTDINGDGKPDIVSGENWYEGPKWVKHKFRSIPFTNNYIDDFSDLPLDVNGDGHIDIVSCAWFAKRIWWSENPGRGRGEWKDHSIEEGFNVEFTFLVDLDNDGKARELLPEFGGKRHAHRLVRIEERRVRAARRQPEQLRPRHRRGRYQQGRAQRPDHAEGWFEAPADARAGALEVASRFRPGRAPGSSTCWM